MRTKLLLVLALFLALAAVSSFGGAWKWVHPPKGAVGIEHVAGWTWDEAPVQGGPGRPYCPGNSCDAPGHEA